MELGFDTETKGFDWFDPEQRAFLGSWADAEGEYVTPDMEKFRAVLEQADTLIAHNAKFDIHQTRATTGLDLLSGGRTIHDTDTLSRIMFPEGQRKGDQGGHGLKNQSAVYLRADAKEPQEIMNQLAESAGIKMKELGGYYDAWRAYPHEVEKYAALDARYTYDLFQLWRKQISEAHARVYRMEMELLPVLVRAEERGVALDQTAVRKLKREYTKKEREVRSYLETELGEEALGGDGSQDALIEALLKIGVPLVEKTDSGKFSTAKFALQPFEDEFPQIAALQEHRQAQKFLSTYIDKMLDREVVHCSFQQIGAWTGRMACRSPNMQNIPKHAGKEVRSMFVPRPGHAFVVMDYEGIELRLLAYYLGDARFREMVENPEFDPHAWMASQISTRTLGDDPASYRKGTEGEPQRDKAKNSLYAIIYGAGGKRLTDMNKLDPGPWLDEDHPSVVAAKAAGKYWPKAGWQYAEGRALARSIKANLPGYHKLNKRVQSKVKNLGHVTTVLGRTQPVSKDKAYVGMDALIQGSAGDIFKQGCINVAQAVAHLGAVPVLFVHDEIVVETPIEHAEECARLTEEALVAAGDSFGLSPRMSVEGGIVTTNYADA